MLSGQHAGIDHVKLPLLPALHTLANAPGPTPFERARNNTDHDPGTCSGDGSLPSTQPCPEATEANDEEAQPAPSTVTDPTDTDDIDMLAALQTQLTSEAAGIQEAGVLGRGIRILGRPQSSGSDPRHTGEEVDTDVTKPPPVATKTQEEDSQPAPSTDNSLVALHNTHIGHS